MQPLISEFPSLALEHIIAIVAIIIIALLFGFFKFARPFKKQQKTQTTETTTSTEDVTEHESNVIISNYHGANVEAVDKLQVKLGINNAITKYLLELLDADNIPQNKRTKHFTKLAHQYKALQERLKQYERDDKFILQAEQHLETGNLAGAERALEASSKHDLRLLRKNKNDLAKRAFDLAILNELQRDYAKAISRYKTVIDINSNHLEARNRFAKLSLHIGNDQQALTAYQQLKQYARDLQQEGWQSISIIGEADILAKQGYNTEALSLYREDLQLIAQQRQKDPENTYWLHKLAARHNKMGDIYKVKGSGNDAALAYQDAIEIRETLAKREPNNVNWQRKLSISFNKLGDTHKANGNSDKAIQAYQDTLVIREALVKQDPNNTAWQHDLSVSFNKLGDMHRANGDNDKAMHAFQDALAIQEMLAKRDLKRIDWQVDLSSSYGKLLLFYKSDDKEKAKEYGEQGLKIQEALHKQKRLPKELDQRHSFVRGLKLVSE